ncbi:MAG: 30S ribosomal protein S6 [bacterium]
MDLPEVINYYEMMLILKAEMPEEQRGAVRQKIEDYIAENGGSISNIEVWGKRPLAYEINHMKEGYYLLYFYHLPPSKIKRLEKNMRVDENVVRFKIFRKELVTLTPPKPAEGEAI